MPTDGAKLLALCLSIRHASEDDLRTFDRETLIAARAGLRTVRDEVDVMLSRLSFLSEESLH
jgi:hypothetical protein